MTALTVYYRKDPQQILGVSNYPAKFVEYSHEQQRKPYDFITGHASLYLLLLLYAIKHTINSTPGVIRPFLPLPFLNKVFINLNS